MMTTMGASRIPEGQNCQEAAATLTLYRQKWRTERKQERSKEEGKEEEEGQVDVFMEGYAHHQPT